MLTSPHLTCSVRRHFRVVDQKVDNLKSRRMDKLKTHNCIRRGLSKSFTWNLIVALGSCRQSPRSLSVLHLTQICPPAAVTDTPLSPLIIPSVCHHNSLSCALNLSTSRHVKLSAPASAISPTELSPRSFHASLKFAVADDEDVLLLAADKLHALVNASVELIETCKHVS